MAFSFTSGGITMTPLRQRMTEDMQLRGLAPATQQAYLRYVEQLALFTGKSPDLASDEDFRLARGRRQSACHPALARPSLANHHRDLYPPHAEGTRTGQWRARYALGW